MSPPISRRGTYPRESTSGDSRSPAQDGLFVELRACYPEVVHDYRPCPHSRFELDIAFPVLQIGIEIDGWRFHGKHKADFYRDRSKRNLLTINDWAVLSYPAHDVSRRRAEVLAEIALLVQQRRVCPPRPAAWSSVGLQKVRATADPKASSIRRERRAPAYPASIPTSPSRET